MSGDSNGVVEDFDGLRNKTQHVTHSEHVEASGAPDAPKSTILTAPPLVQEMTPEERYELERKLVRKIDWRLLPACVVMYIMNYLDRNNIASARIAGKKGLQKGLNLSDTQYEVCNREWLFPVIFFDLIVVDLCLYPVCRLYLDASTLQSSA